MSQQTDDSLSKIVAEMRALSDWMASTVSWSQSSPECGPEPSSQFDYELNEAAGQIHGWASRLSALPSQGAQGEALRGDALMRALFDWRNIDPESGIHPCDGCGGSGWKAYGSTATWYGGVGGQAITADVCDKCWGSGHKDAPWPSHRRQAHPPATPPQHQALDVAQGQAQGEAVTAEEKLANAGVFGEGGLRELAEASEFWDERPYGTRLYYGKGNMDYLHRDVLRAAISILDSPQIPAHPPAAPAPERAAFEKCEADATGEPCNLDSPMLNSRTYDRWLGWQARAQQSPAAPLLPETAPEGWIEGMCEAFVGNAVRVPHEGLKRDMRDVYALIRAKVDGTWQDPERGKCHSGDKNG